MRSCTPLSFSLFDTVYLLSSLQLPFSAADFLGGAPVKYTVRVLLLLLLRHTRLTDAAAAWAQRLLLERVHDQAQGPGQAAAPGQEAPGQATPDQGQRQTSEEGATDGTDTESDDYDDEDDEEDGVLEQQLLAIWLAGQKVE